MSVDTSRFLVSTGARQFKLLTDQWRGQDPDFVCVLAHTDTCLIPGISAAGASSTLRAFTPAADAEVVSLGEVRCLASLPSSPLGPPGPSGITRAAALAGHLSPQFFAAGLRVLPGCAHTVVSAIPGGRIDRGMGASEARSLYQSGVRLGKDRARRAAYLVIAESVPGGTTTALAVLEALGIPAVGRVSGSSPSNVHPLKQSVLRDAFRASGISPGNGAGDPLGVVERVGDPMQPLAAGLAAGAIAAGSSVLLAGGSQMTAVAALLAALEGRQMLEKLVIGTTPWVIRDPQADITGLARDVGQVLPVAAARLSFANSRHAGLRSYEQFMVKEGVGAGGACLAVLVSRGVDLAALHSRIDDVYDRLLGTPQPVAGAERSLESSG